jgi:hypothetical protein
VDTLIFPELNVNPPTLKFPDPKVKVPVLTCVYTPETLKVPVLNCTVAVPLVNVPVLVKVNEPNFKVRVFNVKVVLTSKFEPKVTFDVPFKVKTLTAFVVPGVVWSINKVLVVVPKNTNVAVAFPTIFPPEPVIEPMAVVKDPGLKVKFPEVIVNAYNESVVLLLLPPNVTPPAPFKIKLAG